MNDSAGTPSRSISVFLIHAQETEAFAIDLAHALELANERAFLPTRTPSPGDDLEERARSALREASLSVVLLTSGAQLDTYRRGEIFTAIELSKDPTRHRVIPVLVDGPRAMPDWLRVKAPIDALAAGGPTGVSESLLRVLASMRGAPRAAPVRLTEPFRLLKAFTHEDAAIFFGRELVTRDLLALIDEHRLVVLHGSSGTGKSSLVQAGLRPRIAEGPRYRWIGVTPGDDPLGVLDRALRAELAVADVAPSGSSPSELLLQLSRISVPVLLMIDQAEELFQRRSEDELKNSTAKLGAELDACLRAPSQRGDVHVLISIRSDYFGHLSYLKQSGLPVYETEQLLRPLDRTATQLAIEEPLRLAGYRIEPSLVVQDPRRPGAFNIVDSPIQGGLQNFDVRLFQWNDDEYLDAAVLRSYDQSRGRQSEAAGGRRGAHSNGTYRSTFREG